MIGCSGTDRKNVEVSWSRAGPGVLDGQFRGIGLIESRSRRGQDHRQVEIIAKSGRAYILYADICHRASAYGREVRSYGATGAN